MSVQVYCDACGGRITAVTFPVLTEGHSLLDGVSIDWLGEKKYFCDLDCLVKISKKDIRGQFMWTQSNAPLS